MILPTYTTCTIIPTKNICKNKIKIWDLFGEEVSNVDVNLPAHRAALHLQPTGVTGHVTVPKTGKKFVLISKCSYRLDSESPLQPPLLDTIKILNKFAIKPKKRINI